jgi:hypothetical protein
MRNFLSVLILAAAIIGLPACSNKPEPAPEVSINPETLAKQKKDEAPHATKPAANPDKGHAPQKDGGEKHKIEIVVPDNVKGKWESVKLSIFDKKTNKTQAVNVKLGSVYKIPDSSLTITAGVFLPDFKMDSLTITSVSAELNNPAVNVTISDSGKELFKGWLYSKYPDIHPFEHDRFAVVMLAGVKKN